MRPLMLALSLLCALGQLASAAPRRAVVAPFSALGISPKEAQRVQRWVMSAAASMSQLRFRRVKALDRRLARSPGCVADVRCLGKLVKRLRLGTVLVGDVGSIGGAYVVYLQLIEDGAVTSRESGVLDPRQSLRAAVRALLYKALLPRRYTGSLRVRSNVAAAWVYLDGRRVGRGKVVDISAVRVGRHALRVTHPAHRDFVRFVELAFRQRAVVDAELSPIEVQSQKMSYLAGKPLTDSELPWYRRWWVVATFGAAIFATATAVIATLPQDVERDRALTVVPSR